MSTHMVWCAAQLDLPASVKLALMAFADSANEQTGIAFPGMDQVKKWSNLGKSQADVVVADLVERGLLRRHSRGHRGRRAEYVVFPAGCCEMHRAAEIAPGEPGPMLTAVETDDITAGQELVPTAPPIAPAPPGAKSNSTRKAPGLDRVPSPTPSTNPPIPPALRAGGCEIHETKARNCRGCGTTSRQLRDQRRRDTAEEARQRQRDADERARLELEQAKAAAAASPTRAQARADARAALRRTA